jgi:hypothetical protein
MANPRFNGLLILLIGVLVLFGNTMDVLPPEAFWAGLLTYPIGGYLFFMGSRSASERAETPTARALSPRTRNRPGEQLAELQAKKVANPNAPPSPARSPAPPINAPTVQRDAVAMSDADGDEGEEEVRVTSDVSFPLELQEKQNPADQFRKLAKLQEEGIITAEELAIAKAKLLDR